MIDAPCGAERDTDDVGVVTQWQVTGYNYTGESEFASPGPVVVCLPALVVNLFWRRGTRVGAIASLLIGFAVTASWFYLKKTDLLRDYAWLHEVYLGTVVSLLVFFVVSLMTAGETATADS